MKFAPRWHLFALFLAVTVCLCGLRAVAAGELSAEEIIKRAVAASQKPSQQISTHAGYTYTKVTVTEELDPAGHVRDRQQRVYQVNIRNGASHLSLVTVNGRAPTESDIRKLAENEAKVQESLGKPKGLKSDNVLTPELAARFKFSLVEKTITDGRTSYVMDFSPLNPDTSAHHVMDRFLNSLSGRLWIDAEEFEVARAEIKLGSEVTLLGGMVGSLKKLAYTLTRSRLSDGLWLNTYSRGDYEGRKLIESMRIKTMTQSSNFRPVS
jgi:hypothetical protein